MTNKPESHRMGPPDFLTVEEAAAVLRIGRTIAYREARKFLASNGVEGLCADRVGKQIRIPRPLLDDQADPVGATTAHRGAAHVHRRGRHEAR